MARLFSIEVKGTQRLLKELEGLETKLANRWLRGAVGEMVNVTRDQVQENAVREGLAVAGVYPTTPGGRLIDHRGMIPFAVRGWVNPTKAKGHVTGGVRVVSGRRKSPTQTYHWHFVEFGGPNNPVTRPFFMPAKEQSREPSMAAGIEVIRRNVREWNAKK